MKPIYQYKEIFKKSVRLLKDNTASGINDILVDHYKSINN